LAPPCSVTEGVGRIQGWGSVKNVGQNGEKWLRNVEGILQDWAEQSHPPNISTPTNPGSLVDLFIFGGP